MRQMTAMTAGAILLIGLLHLATLRSGHDWGDDFSLYVAHARNLAEGRSYADTGYIYNPQYPVLSPRAYPPIFPLLLVPIYAVFGLNLVAMKAFVIVLLMATLVVLAAFLRRLLPAPYALGCVCIFGLNPFLWTHKDRLLSDIPFLLFVFLTLLFADFARQPGQRRVLVILWALLTGIASYLAFGTRMVGVVLIPAILGAEFLRWRGAQRDGQSVGPIGHWQPVVVLLPFAALALGQKALFAGDVSYFDQLRFDLALFARISVSLVKAMGYFFDNGHLDTPRNVLFLVLSLLAMVGFLNKLREPITAHALFAGLSFGLLVLWPHAEWQCRYLLPLLPLFLYYVCEGIRWLTSLATPIERCELPAQLTLALAIVVSYAGAFTSLDFGPIRAGVGTPQAQALFDFVRTQTRPDDVFVFQKPRALALFTGRRASGHSEHPTDEQLWSYLRQIQANYVVDVTSPEFASSHELLGPFVTRHPERFDTAFAAGDITVYRITDTRRAQR
jgi:4-amino-4-deoxy-L-arabinose transferase-like glycosyltransferase